MCWYCEFAQFFTIFYDFHVMTTKKGGSGNDPQFLNFYYQWSTSEIINYVSGSSNWKSGISDPSVN